MLPKSKRLTKEQVDVVLEKGRSAHSKHLSVRFTLGNTDTRVAAIAPKKIEKTAVGRNSVKRKIYNLVKDLHIGVSKGAHIVVFSKTSLGGTGELHKEIREIFVKTGLLV